MTRVESQNSRSSDGTSAPSAAPKVYCGVATGCGPGGASRSMTSIALASGFLHRMGEVDVDRAIADDVERLRHAGAVASIGHDVPVRKPRGVEDRDVERSLAWLARARVAVREVQPDQHVPARRHGKAHCLAGLSVGLQRSVSNTFGGTEVGTDERRPMTGGQAPVLLPLFRYGDGSDVSAAHDGPQSKAETLGPPAFTRYMIEVSLPTQYFCCGIGGASRSVISIALISGFSTAWEKSMLTVPSLAVLTVLDMPILLPASATMS
jgi:hypothetical protein